MMPPEPPPDGPVRPRIQRGVPARMRRQGLFKPQHRVVLFLLAASAGSFLLTILFPPKEQAERTGAAAGGDPPVPRPPLAHPRERGAFLVLRPPADHVEEPLPETGDLVTAAQALAPKLSACASGHAAALAPLDGRVVVRAEVGARGLHRAGLVDVVEADPAAVACLAAATWGLRWPPRDPPEGVLVPFYVVAPLERASDEPAAAVAPDEEPPR